MFRFSAGNFLNFKFFLFGGCFFVFIIKPENPHLASRPGRAVKFLGVYETTPVCPTKSTITPGDTLRPNWGELTKINHTRTKLKEKKFYSGKPLRFCIIDLLAPTTWPALSVWTFVFTCDTTVNDCGATTNVHCTFTTCIRLQLKRHCVQRFCLIFGLLLKNRLNQM